MERDFGESRKNISSAESSSTSLQSRPPGSSLPWLLLALGGTQGAIEMVGPRDFKALSGDLVVWTRLSPLVFNLTGTLDPNQSFNLPSVAIQLFFCAQGGRNILLTTQPVPSPLTTSWEKVKISTINSVTWKINHFYASWHSADSGIAVCTACRIQVTGEPGNKISGNHCGHEKNYNSRFFTYTHTHIHMYLAI